MFAPTVAPIPSHSISRASAGASRPLQASCSSTSEAARIGPSRHSGSSRARRTVLVVRVAQVVEVGVADQRREGGHRADHGRSRGAWLRAQM